MEKEKIFSKFNSKDYNSELEELVEHKKYDEMAKNLLLSMLYKVETNYKDYEIVKRVSENKNSYIEEIIKIVDNKCDKIVIAKADSEEAEEMEKRGTKYLVDYLTKTISIVHPNEKLLLYCLYKINNKQIYLEEKYNLIRNALSNLLNVGETINKMEVIRDFTGWTWDITPSEIPEITTNIIYQNLLYLLGEETIRMWTKDDITIDYIKILQQELEKNYGEEIANNILNLIYKISIIVCVEKNSREKERLKDEQMDLMEELNQMNNKEEFLANLSETRKEQNKIIKQIDKIMNDKKLLEVEFKKRNNKKNKYNQLVDINHLIEILNKERKKAWNQMEEAKKLLEPSQFVNKKKEIENQLALIEDINIENQQKRKHKYVIELQKNFIQALTMQLKKITQKEEIINFIYNLRYYNYLYQDEKNQIKDTKELQEQLEQLQRLLIKKAYELKCIMQISKDFEENYFILKQIFLSKIIYLEGMHIKIKFNKAKMLLEIYDKELFEKSMEIPIVSKENLNVKIDKKIKLIL